MTQTHRASARSFMAVLLAVLLVLSSVLAAVAQSPSPSGGAPVAVVTPEGSATLGGVLAETEGRDPGAPPALVLGTSLDGLKLQGPRNAFRPDESVAYRLELSAPVDQVALTVQLAGSVNGVDALWSYPALPVDPTWDTVAGTLPAPPVGDYMLRLFKGTDQVAAVPLAVHDVPRLSALLTDPNGFVSGETDRVAAAGKRYEDATGGGWLWNVLIDTTSGIPVADWTADLWAVNADLIDPRDALFVAAAGDIDVAIQVGTDAARTITTDELGPIEDAAALALGDGRFGDMIDGVADGLVTAHQEGPTASPSPTPSPTAAPTPSTVRVPDFTGMTRADAEQLATRRGLQVKVTSRRTSAAPRGTVVAQDPTAGKSVQRGDTVTLVVAVPAPTVAVPDVSGLSLSDAVGVLLDSGLKAGTRTNRYSDTFAQGTVIRTDPKAGTQVAPGSKVATIVSRGPAPAGSPTPTPTPKPTATPKATPKPITVPNVRGQTPEDAVSALLDAKLTPGKQIDVANKNVPSGEVIRTVPAAGSSVSKGDTVDLYVSTGPAVAGETPAATAVPARTPRPTVKPTPTPTPRPAATPKPTRTPRPTARPHATPRPTATPVPQASTPAAADRLARIQAAGVIRVNLAQDDRPWSFEGDNGGRGGLDAVVARQIANKLGVTLETTFFPIDEVKAGIWDDRFDIAISRLAVTAEDPALLTFSQPYAYDPQQLSVTQESGFTTVDELAGRPICVDATDTGAAWLAGTLALVDSPLEPAIPPAGATAFAGPTNADCLSLVAATGAPFDGWLASRPSLDWQITAGATVSEVGAPVFWAPVAVAFDAKAADNDSLIAAVNDALTQLDSAGTLVKASIRAMGYDLTSVPEDGVPVPIVPVAGTSPAP